MDVAATDPDLDAALARNLSMPEADRQRLAGAVAALHAARPRIVAQQAERVPGGADPLADLVLYHARRALRRAAEQPDLPAALEAPELLRIHDLKASLRAGGTPVPLP